MSTGKTKHAKSLLGRLGVPASARIAIVKFVGSFSLLLLLIVFMAAFLHHFENPPQQETLRQYQAQKELTLDVVRGMFKFAGLVPSSHSCYSQGCAACFPGGEPHNDSVPRVDLTRDASFIMENSTALMDAAACAEASGQPCTMSCAYQLPTAAQVKECASQDADVLQFNPMAYSESCLTNSEVCPNCNLLRTRIRDAYFGAEGEPENQLQMAEPYVLYKDKLESEEPGLDWDWYQSMFFSATVLSTIGYGNTAPVTDDSKIFISLLTIPGVVIFAYALTNLANILIWVVGGILNRMTHTLRRKRAVYVEVDSDKDTSDSVGENKPTGIHKPMHRQSTVLKRVDKHGIDFGQAKGEMRQRQKAQHMHVSVSRAIGGNMGHWSHEIRRILAKKEMVEIPEAGHTDGAVVKGFSVEKMCEAADDLEASLVKAVAELAGPSRLKWELSTKQRHQEMHNVFLHCDTKADGILDESESLAAMTVMVQRRKDAVTALEAQQDVYLVLGLSIVVLTLGVVVFKELEGPAQGWTYLDALYFCIITVTTVGLGDLVPTLTLSSVLFWIIYLATSMGLIAVAISKLQKVDLVAIVFDLKDLNEHYFNAFKAQVKMIDAHVLPEGLGSTLKSIQTKMPLFPMSTPSRKSRRSMVDANVADEADADTDEKAAEEEAAGVARANASACVEAAAEAKSPAPEAETAETAGVSVAQTPPPKTATDPKLLLTPPAHLSPLRLA